MTLRYELEPFVSTGREAALILDELFNNIIAALRRDRRFAEIRLQELELIIADPRSDAEQRLFDELRDRVQLGDVDTVGGAEG